MTVYGGLGIRKPVIAQPRPKSSTGSCYTMPQETEGAKVSPKIYKAVSVPVSFSSSFVCIFLEYYNSII